MRGLFWFREDLRLHDNPALLRLAEQCDELVLVYCFDDQRLRPGRFQSKGMGAPRLGFLRESLDDLKTLLRGYSQELIVRRGVPREVIGSLIQRYSIDSLGITMLPGPDEQKDIEHLLEKFPHLNLVESWGHTLFRPHQLPFGLDELPATFTEFRRQVAQLQPSLPQRIPDSLPPAPLIARMEESDPLPIPESPYMHEWVPPNWFCFHGGERSALRQLHYYLWEKHLVCHYKETRNGFVGWDYSSKLAPWLALGCLSVREAWSAICTYEHQKEKSDSTRLLRDELLWRDYFQWLLFKHGARTFRFTGIQDTRRLLTFYPEAFMAWTQGTTGIPIIDACMRELKTTGWMSNRGRQLVASFLINELMIDWRFGAAWFEQQLIDYDVALNYGNWNYLAGVGVEPQPKRVFNIIKQAYLYDPDAQYVSLWLPELRGLSPTLRHTPFWADQAVEYRCPIVDVQHWESPSAPSAVPPPQGSFH